MSMLSDQYDELRELAAKYDELKSGATRVVRISLDTGPVLREAVDTIDRLDAENARLRELLSEIAKLVTNSYGGCLRPGCAHGCPHYLECDEELHTCFYVDRMRELGVVVE